MGTAQSASTPGHLKATGNRQSFHKLVIGNWNITSLTGKEHEPLEEAKDISPVLVTSLRRNFLGLLLLSQKSLPRLRWGYYQALSWQVVLVNGHVEVSS